MEVLKLLVETYAYKVPRIMADRYLDIQRRTKDVYLRYGCIDYEVFKSDDDWCLEVCRFKDRKHYEDVMKSVDLDPEIELLWKEFCSIVDEEKVATKRSERIL